MVGKFRWESGRGLSRSKTQSRSITTSTYASLPALVGSREVEASGTSTCANAGLGLLTVRAHSYAITVNFWPTWGSRSGRSVAISAVTPTFGYRWPMRFSALSRIHWT